METRHPVEEPFGSEFSAICNHCGVYRPEIARSGNFVSILRVFLEKNGSSQTVATARIATKICQGQPPHLAHTVPDFIQIGSLFDEYFQYRLFEPITIYGTKLCKRRD